MPRSQPVDGFSLAYDRHGAATPVILLHGWPGDRYDWREIVPRLEADVLVPDLRGFGESDKHAADPAEQYSAAGQARSVIGLIDELGLEPPVVCGYDVGSRVAQAIAAELDRLAAAYGEPGAFLASINWYRGSSGAVARSLAETPPQEPLRTPTTVLWPEHDPLFPRAWSDRVGEFFADAEVVPLDGAGHFSPLEAPEAWARAIARAQANGGRGAAG